MAQWPALPQNRHNLLSIWRWCLAAVSLPFESSLPDKSGFDVADFSLGFGFCGVDVDVVVQGCWVEAVDGAAKVEALDWI